MDKNLPVKNNNKEIRREYRRMVIKAAVSYIVHSMQDIPNNFKMLTLAAKGNHYPRLFMYIDYVFSVILLGDSIQEYLWSSKFRHNPAQKFQFYTRRREFFICYLYTRKASSATRINLDSKNRFYKTYASFLKRETLFVPEHSDAEILEFVRRHKKLIAKPTDTYGGKGVHLIKADDLTPSEIKRLRDEKYLLEEILIQHPKMSEINASSVNTVRVTTILDAEGRFHIENAYLRAGLPGSLVDNLSSGGIAYLVDSKTGTIVSHGVSTRYHEPSHKHPGSDTIMLGFKIPMWHEAVQMCEQVANVQPELRRIGWDIAITKDGPALIEGNSVPAIVEIGKGTYFKAWKYLRRKKNNQSSSQD